MAISVNWPNKIITVPKADTQLVDVGPPEIRELNVDTFRLALKDLEDNEEGMMFPDTHKHTTETTLGGVTYARFVEIINGYTLTFEDGNYAVNLYGANNNLSDVLKIKIKRLSKKDKKKTLILNKKIKEIINNDKNSIDRYKNLKHGLKEIKRVHIDKHFVLSFKVDKEDNYILFLDFEHHDNAY